MFVPKTTETSSTTTTGSYNAIPTAPPNETPDNIQKDSGQYFRIVDCKYIYNLDISTLSGPGTYRVYANINSMRVRMSPAVFRRRAVAASRGARPSGPAPPRLRH